MENLHSNTLRSAQYPQSRSQGTLQGTNSKTSNDSQTYCLVAQQTNVRHFVQLCVCCPSFGT